MAVRQQALACFRREARQQGTHYYRARDLPGLIPCEVGWAEDQTCVETTERILTLLKSALGGMIKARAKRRWYYDHHRHLALSQAMAAEIATLKRQRH